MAPNALAHDFSQLIVVPDGNNVVGQAAQVYDLCRPKPSGRVFVCLLLMKVHFITDFKIEMAHVHGGARVHSATQPRSS